MNMHSRWITQKNVDQLRAELKDNVEALDFINNRIADGVLILVSAETVIAEVNKEELFGMMTVVQHAGASKELARTHVVPQEEERRRAIERIHSLSAFLKSFPDGLPEFHSLELVAEGKAVCVRKDGTSVFLTNNTITVLHVEPPTLQ